MVVRLFLPPADCCRVAALVIPLLILPGLVLADGGRTMLKATCGGVVVTQGESTIKGFNDHVEISSVHHDMQNSVTLGSGTGKVASGPIRIVKPQSASSLKFIENVIRGHHCSEVLIRHFLDTDLDPMVEIWRMTLTDVFTVERNYWTAGSDARPQESLSFLPVVIEWTYFHDSGSASFGWDFEQNSSK